MLLHHARPGRFSRRSASAGVAKSWISVALASTAIACSDSGPTAASDHATFSTAAQATGAIQFATAACFSSADALWTGNGTHFYGTSLNPSVCPVRLSHQGVMQSFSATVLAPPFVSDLFSYAKSGSGATLATGGAAFAKGGPGGWSTASQSINYLAGTAGPDTLHLEVLDYVLRFYHWYEVVNYVFDSTTKFTGPTTINSGTIGTWSITGLSTNAHTYQWYQNGVLQTTQTTYQFSYRPILPQVFKLHVDARDAVSGWIDSTTWNVVANFSTTLYGPTSVNSPGGTCTFSVANQGGIRPFTYLWTFDGNDVATTAMMAQEVLGAANSSHALSIMVTDSTGTSRSIQRIVKLVIQGGSTCLL